MLAKFFAEHVDSIAGLEFAGEASTGAEAISRIFDLRPDVVLLDLQMPELDGLSVVRSLSGERTPLIIFVTAYENHALAAFEVGAVDYLLKPVRRERLEKAIEKARRQLKPAPVAGRPAKLYEKLPGRREQIFICWVPAEIVAFQADGELVHIVTTAQRYLSDHSLKALEDKLPGAQTLSRRIHRSTIINTDHIRKISPLSSKRWLLRMSNTPEAVVSVAGQRNQSGIRAVTHAYAWRLRWSG